MRKKGESVRVIVCVPDPSNLIDSAHAIRLNTADGRSLVFRVAGESEFATYEGQFDTKSKHYEESVVIGIPENWLTFEVLNLSDGTEVPAFSFLDEQSCVSVQTISILIEGGCEDTLNNTWTFKANIASLREFELRLRTESLVAWLCEDQSEFEESLYSNKLKQVASSIRIGPNLFLPLQCDMGNTVVACVVHLQEAIGSGKVRAEMFIPDLDWELPAAVDLKNVDGETLLTATIV